MFIWFSTLAYCALFGIALGGMLISKRNIVGRLYIFFIGISFAILTYLGMTIGSWILSFLPFRFVEIFFSIILLGFIFFSIMSHHPQIGYLHEQSKGLILIAGSLFFIIGIEWMTLSFPLYFSIIGSIVFLGMLIVGVTLQINIIKKAWQVSFITLVPMLWLVFIVIMKLF